MNTPFPIGQYDLIVADPPWSYEMRSDKGYEKSPQAHYECMTLEEIKALPFDFLAGPNCLIILWAVWPMLTEALQLMSAWGFTYKTGGHWHKMTKHGKQHFGTGYIVRGASEPFLIGTLGAPKTSKSCRNAIEGIEPPFAGDAIIDRVREHSRKPEAFYPWAEKLMPGAHRIELFARQTRPGWDVWGNEVDKFEKETT